MLRETMRSLGEMWVWADSAMVTIGCLRTAAVEAP